MLRPGVDAQQASRVLQVLTRRLGSGAGSSIAPLEITVDKVLDAAGLSVGDMALSTLQALAVVPGASVGQPLGAGAAGVAAPGVASAGAQREQPVAHAATPAGSQQGQDLAGSSGQPPSMVAAGAAAQSAGAGGQHVPHGAGGSGQPPTAATTDGRGRGHARGRGRDRRVCSIG